MAVHSYDDNIVYLTLWVDRMGATFALSGIHPLAKSPELLNRITDQFQAEWQERCKQLGNQMMHELDLELQRLADPREAIRYKLKYA